MSCQAANLSVFPITTDPFVPAAGDPDPGFRRQLQQPIGRSVQPTRFLLGPEELPNWQVHFETVPPQQVMLPLWKKTSRRRTVYPASTTTTVSANATVFTDNDNGETRMRRQPGRTGDYDGITPGPDERDAGALLRCGRCGFCAAFGYGPACGLHLHAEQPAARSCRSARCRTRCRLMCCG